MPCKWGISPASYLLFRMQLLQSFWSQAHLICHCGLDTNLLKTRLVWAALEACKRCTIIVTYGLRYCQMRPIVSFSFFFQFGLGENLGLSFVIISQVDQNSAGMGSFGGMWGDVRTIMAMYTSHEGLVHCYIQVLVFLFGLKILWATVYILYVHEMF